MITHEIIHASQRYDRPDATLRDAVATYRRQASVVTYTEVGGARRRPGLATGWHDHTATGWHDHTAADCAVTWRVDEWWIRASGRVTTDRAWTTKDGGKGRTLASPVVVLEHRATGERVVVAVMHLPAGVEALLAKGRVSRVAAHAAHAHAVRRRGNALARQHPGATRIILGDWNINAATKSAKAWLRTVFPRWTVVAPSMGTHGPRVIDFAVVRGATATARTLPQHPSSDHRAVLVRWTAKRGRAASAQPVTDEGAGA